MNNPSVTICCNFFNEANALPGFLEMATGFADEVLMVDCGPGGTRSSDGSLDILRKWRIEPLSWRIDEGFGKARTQLIHTCETSWCIIMDSDERLQIAAEVISCEGTDRYPAVPNPNLTVIHHKNVYDHREVLLSMMRHADTNGIPSIRAIRRHWFDFTGTRPCENWSTIFDWQLRIWRVSRHVGYRTDTPMHEKAWDWRANAEPRYLAESVEHGPFFDHYHCHFKPMEPEQRQHDIRIYNAIHERQAPPTA